MKIYSLNFKLKLYFQCVQYIFLSIGVMEIYIIDLVTVNQ